MGEGGVVVGEGSNREKRAGIEKREEEWRGGWGREGEGGGRNGEERGRMGKRW